MSTLMASNIVHKIRAKERKTRNLIRTNHKIIRAIICQDDVDFKKVWETKASGKISYDSHRIYLDNYKECMNPAARKIEDALYIVCQYHMEEISEDTRPHLITLTKDNWVVRSDLNTGAILQRIYLHPQLNYNYLSWNDEGASFVVTTVKSTTTPSMREAGIASNILLTMAIFTVCPLELAVCFQVDRQIFGNNLTGAHVVANNILFTSHQRGIVKFYDFEMVLAKNPPDEVRLGDAFPGGEGEGCKVGEAPHGIPITLRVKEMPPVLLEVCCYDDDICFGGIPWHYLASPKGGSEATHVNVYSVATKEMAINGSLERNALAFGTPGAVFHFDGTERIIHTRARSLNVLKLKQRNDGTCEVVEDHEIDPRGCEDDADSGKNRTSCRPHRRRSYSTVVDFTRDESFESLVGSQMITDFSYENDLDLMVVSMPSYHWDSDHHQGSISLHDNQAGRLLKTIQIPGEWDDTVEHTVTLDLDTLIHIVKDKSGKWRCQVFRAQRRDVHKKSAPGSRKSSRRSGQRRGSRWR
ncbi:DDB1- and CUL4-associated factor 17-like [Diadema antillarum]|uniref:DDB1- and CUL4-associated factor 17-like n=1 Tax=Diadema antillarum TaxID=105358 RepID=UPI003A879F3F